MAPGAPQPHSKLHLAPADLAAPGRALPPGTVLAEFEFGHVLADSRFSIVYQATDHSMDRQVAIKEYLPTSLCTRSEGVKVQLRALSHAHAFERGRRSFIEEAKQLGRCDHPALLRMHRLMHANGTVYRVMPFCPGISLLDLRQQLHTPPRENQLREVLTALLGALDALHRQGIVHGEVAPANILLQQADERPLLMDFGAVRRSIVSDPTRSWMTLLGSSGDVLDHEADAQLAQARHQWPADGPAGPWNDLSSLAAVLYFWITGHWPEYPPAEPLSRVVARLHEYLPQLEYSASLLAAIDAALAPGLQDRPQSVAHFHELLSAAKAAESLRAAPSSPALAPQVAADTAAEAAGDTEAATAPGIDAAGLADAQGLFVHMPGETDMAGEAPTTSPAPVDPPPTPTPAPTIPLAPTPLAEDRSATAAPRSGPIEFDRSAVPLLSDVAPAPRPPTRSRPPSKRPEPSGQSRWALFGIATLGVLVVAGGAWQLKRQLQANAAQNVMANAARSNPVPAALATPSTLAPVAPVAASAATAAPPASQVPADPSSPLPTEPTRAGPADHPQSLPVMVSGNPREACSGFPPSALRHCLQTLCAEPAWSAHEQCTQLRDTNRVE